MLRRQLHQSPARVNQRHPRPHPRKRHRRTLVNLHLQAVRNKAHHAGRFHPWNLLQLNLLLRQRNEEDVAPNVGAHHFHNLSLAYVLHARDFNVVARFHAEAPRMFAIVIQRGRGQPAYANQGSSHNGPQQTIRGFLGKRTSAGGNPLLPAQERRFLIHIQVNEARVIHLLARSLSAGWVQLLLQDGGTRLPRHQ